MPQHGPPGDPHNTNPWRWWAEDFPAETYQALRPRTGSPGFVDFYRQTSGERRVEQDFQAANSQRALQGLAPNLNRIDFLQDYPFLLEYQRLSPTQRGGSRISGPRASFNLTAGLSLIHI